MPVYALTFRPSAEKELAKIPEPYKTRIAIAIRELAYNPRPHGYKKLIGQPLYRIRIGMYRVVYTVDDATITVTVTKARHRKNVY